MTLDSACTGDRGASNRIEWLDLAKVFSSPPPALDFVWPGFLSGTAGVLAAPGSSGKSWWALEALCAVAGGREADLLGVQPGAAGTVVYLCLEDLTPIVSTRLCALRERFTEDVLDQLVERLRIAPLAGQRLNLLDRRQRDWLAHLTEGVRLCVIDTLSRSHAGDENSNGEMSQLLSNLEWVCARSGTSILVSHHVRKGGVGDGPAQQAPRGASSLVDNARWAGGLCGMSEGEAELMSDPHCSPDPLRPAPVADRRGWYVKFQTTKPNYGPPRADVWYRREDGGVLVQARLEHLPAGAKSSSGTPAAARAADAWRGRPGK